MDAANDESTSLAIHDDDDAELAECISYVAHAEYACDARDARDARDAQYSQHAIGADSCKLNPTRKTTKATARLWHRNL